MINKNTMKIKNIKTSTSVYLSPVNWGRGSLLATLHFCLDMPSSLCLVSLVEPWFLVVPCGWVEEMKPPLCWWQVSLYDWEGVFHIEVDDEKSLKILTWRVCTCFIPPVVLLPWLSSVSSHGSHPVCYLMVSMGWDVYPSTKCMQSCKHPCPLHITWNLHLSWMLQLMSMGEVVASNLSTPGSLPSLMLGDSQTITCLWHSLAVIPPGSRLNWGGAGTSHTGKTPTHKGMPASDAMRRRQLQCRAHYCPCWSVTSYKGMSFAIWCTTSWGLSSHLSSIFLFPLKASASTRTRSPGFKSMVPIFWS